MLLRRLLEELQLGLARERITRALRQPETLPQLVSLQAVEQLVAVTSTEPGRSMALPASTAHTAATAVGEAVEQLPSRGEDVAADQPVASAAALAFLERLQRDLEACVLCDKVYSPAAGERAAANMCACSLAARRLLRLHAPRQVSWVANAHDHQSLPAKRLYTLS
jgi:hypothetical protein